MKVVLAVLVLSIVPSLMAQDKKPDTKAPVMADSDKAELAVYERDLAQVQAQIQQLQQQYKDEAAVANGFIQTLQKKCDCVVDAQGLKYVAKPVEAPKEEPKK